VCIYLCIRAWLLAAKLIAWEDEHLDPVLLKRRQALEQRVARSRVSAFGGHVYAVHDLALQGAEGDVFALGVLLYYVVERRGEGGG